MLNNIIQKGKNFLEKSRKVKSRGIALCHVDQGYSANNRPVSLLTKSDISPDKLTVDIVKGLEQVELRISMEDFLRRWFGLWCDDAELLTKMLGFETQLEYDASQNPSDDWLQDYNQRHQEYLAEQLSSFAVINKAKELVKSKEGLDSLTAQERYDLFKIRKAFEEGCEEQQLTFEDDVVKHHATPPAKPEPVAAAPAPSAPVEPVQSSSGAKPETSPKEKIVENDVTKSAEFVDMKKANEELTAQMKAMQEDLAAAREIVKAHAVARRNDAITKAAAMPFVGEDQREAVADVILDTKMSTVVAVLEKATNLLAEKDAALTAKDAEIEEVKKSFASGEPAGADGALTPEAKGEDDAQERLNRAIEAHKAKIAAKNS